MTFSLQEVVILNDILLSLSTDCPQLITEYKDSTVQTNENIFCLLIISSACVEFLQTSSSP